MFKDNGLFINLVEEKTLTQSQCNKIGELLSSAIKNKEHPYNIDLMRAAVLIHSIMDNGYSLDYTEINKITEESNPPYPETLKQRLSGMADAYYYYEKGMKDLREREYYTFKE